MTAAAILAICLLTLVETTNKAEAAFPGENGKIACACSLDRNTGLSDNSEIYTVNADGSDLVKITNNPSADVLPARSPDGTKIAFGIRSSSNTTENAEIHTINVDGTGEKALTNITGAEYLFPEWSPDGRRIVYEGTTGIEVMNADGTEQRPLYSGIGIVPRIFIRSAWSPDGKKIALATADGEIGIINPDGSGLASITRTPDLYVDQPNWQPLPEPTPRRVYARRSTPPDTGGPSLLLVASVLLFSGGVMFYAGLKRRM